MNKESSSTDLIWEAEEEPPPDLAFHSFLEDLFAHLELENAAVAVLVTDDDRVRALNKQFRDRDRATDVLSFPSGSPALPDRVHHLGDIVIGLQCATRQATEIGHGLSRELRFLILHGLLHLLGYDHETDNGEMLALQDQIKRSLPAHFAKTQEDSVLG